MLPSMAMAISPVGDVLSVARRIYFGAVLCPWADSRVDKAYRTGWHDGYEEGYENGKVVAQDAVKTALAIMRGGQK